jgi:adenylate cyclase
LADEIERKFLVVGDEWRESVESSKEIEQGYISDHDGITLRVRIAGEQAWLTLKGPSKGIRRAEFEYLVPLEDGRQMLSELAGSGGISKIRYRVRCGAHVWDLDEFRGANQGLVMAEIELRDENESFEMPIWAGEEVSADPRYYNASLVKKPYTSWP